MRLQYRGGLLALAAGIALAAPARAAFPRSVAAPAPALASNPRTPQGYLGIDVRDVSEESVSTLRLKDARGAEITLVDHDGPAGKMGLREHDVVLQMNGIAIEGREQIRRLLHELVPGRTVSLVISRDGQQTTVSAQMADRGEVERQAWEQHLTPGAAPGGSNGPQAPATALPAGDGAPPGAGGLSSAAPSSRYSKSFLGTLLMSPSYTGVVLEAMGPQLADFFGVSGGTGLLVRSVAANSPAALAGMRAGDIVTRLNAQPVGNAGRWAKTIHEAKGRPVTVTIVRDRQEKTLTLIADSRRHSSLNLLAMPGAALVFVASARPMFLR